jgi:hypothetical protein
LKKKILKNMKRIILVFGLLLSVLACKDGVIEVPEFTFEATVYTCDTYTLHRRNGDNTKALVLTLQATDLPSVAGTSTLSSSGRTVLYRVFDGAIASSYFCSAVPPASPQVVEEWEGTAFSITIVTAEDTSTSPTSYHHAITLNDLLLSRASEQEIFETFYFGLVDTE